jgi:(1->4)-alpha-D-glucan 1-alpha-D-glucosylmutase
LAFHRFSAERQMRHPGAMNATTTHDTKRSEDTRARIAVLSEIPAEWESALQSWSKTNAKFARKLNGLGAPDRNEEYLFYQTLIGVWPLTESDWPALVPRVQDYLIKALREANVHSRWTQPNQAHETALSEFVARVLDRANNPAFHSSFDRFQQRTALYGMLNGLAQTLLKITCPGVPDCYQGSELWDLRLVDPDNRGPIEFQTRAASLASLRCGSHFSTCQAVEDLLKRWPDGAVKMHTLAQALKVRNENAALLQSGDYVPLQAEGPHADRVIAFARVHSGNWLIVVSPRCVASLNAPIFGAGERQAFWSNTTLTLPEAAPQNWRNKFAQNTEKPIEVCNHRLDLGQAFGAFPVALLLTKVGQD